MIREVHTPVPYGSRYVDNITYECDGECCEECLTEDKCECAVRCPDCGEVFCYEMDLCCPYCGCEDFV